MAMTMQKMPHFPLSEKRNPPMILRISRIEAKTKTPTAVPIAIETKRSTSAGAKPCSVAACLAAALTAGMPLAKTIISVTKRMREIMVAIKMMMDQTEVLFFMSNCSFLRKVYPFLSNF